MGVTVNVNNQSVVHKASGGMTIAFPDLCKIPAPGTPPIPFPNIAKAGDTAKGTKKVKCDGNPICLENSNFSTSTGDEPGVVKGLVSSKIKGIAQFANASANVKVEGKKVPRGFDPMLHNKKNTAPMPLLQPPA